MMSQVLSPSALNFSNLYLSPGVVIPSNSHRTCQQMLEAHSKNVRYGVLGKESQCPMQHIVDSAWQDISPEARLYFFGYEPLSWWNLIALADLWRQDTFRARCDVKA